MTAITQIRNDRKANRKNGLPSANGVRRTPGNTLMGVSVSDIQSMSRDLLLNAWSEAFDTPAPKGMSQPFMRYFLSFEVQARGAAGLPKGFLKKLDKAARSGATQKPRLADGGRLLREWNGTTHIVEVCDNGFRWNAQDYRSLSAVARAITGARWSGPRFFGLKEAAS